MVSKKGITTASDIRHLGLNDGQKCWLLCWEKNETHVLRFFKSPPLKRSWLNWGQSELIFSTLKSPQFLYPNVLLSRAFSRYPKPSFKSTILHISLYFLSQLQCYVMCMCTCRHENTHTCVQRSENNFRDKGLTSTPWDGPQMIRLGQEYL